MDICALSAAQLYRPTDPPVPFILIHRLHRTHFAPKFMPGQSIAVTRASLAFKRLKTSIQQ